MKNGPTSRSFACLIYVGIIIMLLYPTTSLGQETSLAALNISMTLINVKDKSSIKLTSEDVELTTTKTIVKENEDVQQLLTSNGIYADGESIGILYRLNPTMDPKLNNKGAEIVVPTIKTMKPITGYSRDKYLLALTLDRKMKQDLLDGIRRLDVAAAAISGLGTEPFGSTAIRDSFTVLTRTILESMETFKVLIRERTRPLSLELIRQMNDEAEQVISMLDTITHKKGYRLTENDIGSARLIAKNMTVRMKSLDETKGSGGIPSRWPEVRVSIRVVNTVDGKEVKNLRVYYVGQGLWNTRSKYERSFDKLSSPSERDLPEADYYIWAGKPQDSTPLSDRKSLEIRRKTENERVELDLTIK